MQALLSEELRQEEHRSQDSLQCILMPVSERMLNTIIVVDSRPAVSVNAVIHTKLCILSPLGDIGLFTFLSC